MTIYTGIIILFWIIFIVVWLILAFTAKRNARFNSSGIVIRLVFIAVVIVILHFFPDGTFEKIASERFVQTSSPILGIIGDTFSGIGVAFAIWARVYLGRNWGMPMSVKKDPELVTTGPYAYVRHPIYTGMLLAILGAALATNPWWIVILAIVAAYFIYSAMQEEKLMTQTFPDTYPAYKARTKMLVPFIF